MRKLFLLVVFLPASIYREADRPPAPVAVPAPAPVKVCRVVVTAYSSEVAQTDDTPELTAAQTPVREGIVAARWLPFGAKVRIRGHFGEEELTVEDRMAKRHYCKMDIWMASAADADAWGIREVEVEVLEPRNAECPPRLPSVKYRCPVQAAS